MVAHARRDGSENRSLALVTGASAGIGRVFAERLAHEGYDLLLVARRRERLEELAKRLGRGHGTAVDVLPADLSLPEELRAVEERIREEPRLELLVNNAGFGTFGSFAELDADGEEKEIRVNVVAVVRLARAALSGFLERNRGALINVSSLAAFQPGGYNATYSATKAFVNSFTEALHEELRGTAVRVQVLCPGFTRTEFQERAGIDPGRVPSFAWFTPEAVVEASLASLRRGELVCVPGLGNRVLALLTRAAPRALARRVAASLARRGIA